MNAKATQQLVKMLTRMDRRRRRRQALFQLAMACLWWTELRRAPNSGGDAA